MLEKFIRNWYTKIIIHALIIVGVIGNGYYMLENYKLSKNNQKIESYNLILEEEKKSLLNQNSYEFLETYKDKIIKKSGFKKNDEQIFDISKIDIAETNKDDNISLNLSNWQKWYNCLWSRNTKTDLQEKNNPFCRV
jgi:hypothetical protein